MQVLIYLVKFGFIFVKDKSWQQPMIGLLTVILLSPRGYLNSLDLIAVAVTVNKKAYIKNGFKKTHFAHV